MRHSPIDGEWEIHLCNTCFFSWRTNEPESVVNPELYDERYRLTPEKIALFTEFPTVPTRLRKRRP